MRCDVGMYGGSFNPLHIGHLECIIHAANICKELYIVISVGRERDEIDYRTRYRWIYTLTKHIGNVKIIPLYDDYKDKLHYSEEQAKIDSEKVKKSIGKPIDIVFCGSDYDEKSFWNRCYPESKLMIIKRNDISSTEIRKNPYKHFDWLPNTVKAYYNKKVLLIGAESAGKSTLCINLANIFNTNFVEEAGREISGKSGTDSMMLPEDFTEILLVQKLNEMKAAEKSNKVLFVDTDALITRFFIDFFEDGKNEENKALADAIDMQNDYDLILFLEPDVDFVQDGDRSEKIANNRTKYSEKIKKIFEEHNKNFVCVNGDYENRFNTCRRLVSELIGDVKIEA